MLAGNGSVPLAARPPVVLAPPAPIVVAPERAEKPGKPERQAKVAPPAKRRSFVAAKVPAPKQPPAPAAKAERAEKPESAPKPEPVAKPEKAAPKAGRVHLIALDGTAYVKADKTFWSQQSVPFLVSLFGDQFVKVPAGVVPVIDQLTLKAFVTKSIGTYAASDLPAPVTETTVNGIDCWVLTTTSGKPADGALYVSKSAAEVVRWVGTPQQRGRLDFSRWNQKLGVTAPPADQVFSIG